MTEQRNDYPEAPAMTDLDRNSADMYALLASLWRAAPVANSSPGCKACRPCPALCQRAGAGATGGQQPPRE